MFTGIITDVGTVTRLEQKGDLRARIETAYDVETIDMGASIACDGVCLTVVAVGKEPSNWFDVDISAETVEVTAIGGNGWTVGRRINLERALRLGDELGGHIVTGHVDGIAQVTGVEQEGDSTRVTCAMPST